MDNCDFVCNLSGLVMFECNINSTEVTAALLMQRERDGTCRLRFATCPRLHYACFAYVLPFHQNYDLLSQHQVGYPVRDLIHAIPIRAFDAHLL